MKRGSVLALVLIILGDAGEVTEKGTEHPQRVPASMPLGPLLARMARRRCTEEGRQHTPGQGRRSIRLYMGPSAQQVLATSLSAPRSGQCVLMLKVAQLSSERGVIEAYAEQGDESRGRTPRNSRPLLPCLIKRLQ